MDKFGHRMLEHCQEGFCRYGFDDGRILEANPAMVTILGLECSPEELVGRSLVDAMMPISGESQMNEQLVRQGELHGYESHIRTLRGDERWVTGEFFLRWDAKTRQRVVEAVLQDVTARRRAEMEASDVQARFRALSDSAPSLIMIVRDGRIVYANRACEATLGYRAEDLCLPRFAFVELFAMESMTRIKSTISKQSRGGEPHPEEHVMVSREGRRIHATVTITATRHDGAPALMVVATDVTEHLAREESLRESEARFRQMFEAGLFGMAIVGLNYRFVKANSTLCQLLGYTEEELASISFLDLTHPEDAAKDVRLMQQVFTSKVPSFTTQTRYIHRDKRTLWGNLTASVIRGEGERVLYGLIMVEDITERKTAENALRESEERYRKLVETMSQGLGMTDENGSFTYVNDRFCKLVGYPREEIIGRAATQFMDRTNQKILLENTARQRKGESMSYELTWTRHGGDPVPTIVSPEGLFDRRNRFNGIFAVITDITERKRVEETTKAALREKDILLREIHHRVKNNLQIIASLLKLQSALIENVEARSMFKMSHDRIRTMALIHEKLYQSKDLARIDFSAYIRSLGTHLLASYAVTPGDVRIATRADHVYLDINTAIPCGLIINELVSNALKHAFPRGRTGEIHVECHASKDGPYTLLVSDNGVGFPPEVDFQSTETLGLQLVNTLVRQLEGSIALDTAGGTKYTITFAELKYRQADH